MLAFSATSTGCVSKRELSPASAAERRTLTLILGTSAVWLCVRRLAILEKVSLRVSEILLAGARGRSCPRLRGWFVRTGVGGERAEVIRRSVLGNFAAGA